MPYSPPNLGTFLLDPNSGRLLAVDCQAVTKLNLNNVELGSSRLIDLAPKLTKQEQTALLDQNDNQSRELPTLIPGSNGSELAAILRVVPLSGPQQKHLLLTVHPEIREQGHLTHRDALTGLPDRRELAAHHQRWMQAVGTKPLSFAVLFMDLDKFKQINDQHGHPAGDQVLIELAKRWQNCIRDDDLVVRYGGDEFVVLLAKITSRIEAGPVISRLSEETSKAILIGSEQISLGVTIGVAVSNNESSELAQVIAAADRDMYASKRL